MKRKQRRRDRDSGGTTVEKSPASVAAKRSYPGRESAFSLLVVVAIACAVYFNSLANQFVFDDRFFIIDHPYTKFLGHLPYIFTTGQMAGTGPYRPLVTLSYAFDYQVGGLNPFGYHFVNIILHGANVALLYQVVRLLFGSDPIAFIAALLFAVHPIHTEAVAWIGGRSELLAALFFLLSWLFYLKIPADRQPRVVSYAPSLLFFFLALLSKEHALMLPAVLFLSDAYRAVCDTRKNSRPPVDFFLAPFGSIQPIWSL